MYETVLSIPVGKDSIIQYSGGGVGEINGPNAIAILPDETFMIADLVSNRLLQYNIKGELLNTIELEDLGIKIAADMRVKGSEVFLLELGTGPIPQKYWIRHLSLDGTLISNDEIPPHFPIGDGNTLESGLTGISIDCEGNIFLESAGNLYSLADVQTKTNPEEVARGYYCNNKLYLAISSGPAKIRKIFASDVTYETQLTLDLGGLSFLDVNPNGSFYLIREDVVNFQQIKVDQTVFYVGADGSIVGVARVPISESYYYVIRDMAIGPTGEVYFLLPRPDSLDIIRLNFYKEIGPLTAEAVPPNLTVVNENP